MCEVVAHPCKDDKVLFIVACTNIQDFTNRSNYSPEIFYFMKVAKHQKTVAMFTVGPQLMLMGVASKFSLPSASTPLFLPQCVAH